MTTAYVAEFDDFLESDGQSLILISDQLYRLSQLGTLLVRYCSTRACTLAELTEHCLAAFGQPAVGDPRDILIEDLNQLVSLGIMRSMPGISKLDFDRHSSAC